MCIRVRVRVLQREIPETKAWSQISCMATNHSSNDDACTIHVGMDRAFQGSGWDCSTPLRERERERERVGEDWWCEKLTDTSAEMR